MFFFKCYENQLQTKYFSKSIAQKFDEISHTYNNRINSEFNTCLIG